MRLLLLSMMMLVICQLAYSQSGTRLVASDGDTLNKVDAKGQKQGKWLNHVDEIRGEPGFEEEGEYKNNRKEGRWRIYDLQGDLIGVEFYKWGYKDGLCQYFSRSGELIREETWRALNPDKLYDTIQVEDLDHLDQYKTVVIKNEGAAIKDGLWKFYDQQTGMIYRTESYTLGKLNGSPPKTPTDSTSVSKTLVKPKEVQDYEKKNSGKKKIQVRDGATSY